VLVTVAMEMAVALPVTVEMAVTAEVVTVEMAVTAEVVTATKMHAAEEAAAVTAEAAGFGIGCGDGDRTGESQSCDREIFDRLAGHGTLLGLAEA